MMYFTRYFHYLRNPYPQNDHYLQFHYTRIKSPHTTIYVEAIELHDIAV